MIFGMTNNNGTSPKKAKSELNDALQTLSSTFSFRRIDDVELVTSRDIQFGFETKMGTEVKGNLYVGPKEVNVSISMEPEDPPYIDFIPGKLETEITRIFG